MFKEMVQQSLKRRFYAFMPIDNEEKIYCISSLDDKILQQLRKISSLN